MSRFGLAAITAAARLTTPVPHLSIREWSKVGARRAHEHRRAERLPRHGFWGDRLGNDYRPRDRVDASLVLMVQMQRQFFGVLAGPSPALPLLALVQRELRPPHTPTGEHPRGGRDRGGEDFEYPTDEWLPGGFEDDHGNRPFGPLLVAGVALENRDDLGPELGPLLFGSDAGDHGASPACDRGAYLWVGPEV